MRWSIIGLSAFIGSVMLSTVDSGFMSVALIIVRDIIKAPLGPLQRFIVNLAVISLMAVLADLLVEFNVNVLVFLNATYAWGLIFGAISLAALFNRRIGSVWVYVSLSLGAIIGSIETFNPTNLPDMITFVAPSVAAIFVSGAIILLALPFSNRLLADKSTKPKL
jgi:hypothetical protein